ncbi:MAG: STAS/SEC14 domain-containing protein [Geobacteraceae bacterium]|nr:STAS/SEC14 domain-containing protein [Geobacteraceae bacterium]
MEYTISINHEERYLEVNARGAASTSGFRSFIEDLLEPAYADLNYNLLVEFSLLDTSSLGSGDIRNIVAFLEMRKEKLRPRKNAFVAASTITFGFARMYQILSEDVLPMSIQVFTSREQALEWLRDDSALSFQR